MKPIAVFSKLPDANTHAFAGARRNLKEAIALTLEASRTLAEQSRPA